MSLGNTWRAMCASLVMLLFSLHVGAAAAGKGEVIVHVQILKDGHIIEDVTVNATQGMASGMCYGTALTPTEAAAQRRITCNGLLLAFTPRELHEDAIHASFAVEYFKPVNREGGATARFEGFSFAASPAMTPGTPIVAGQLPYVLRLSARYPRS